MASDVLGLIFDIAADPSKAEKAMTELNAASVAESGELSSVWSGAMEAMTGPTGIALGAIVGLGGGMLEMANKAAEAGNEVFEASEKTGIAADKISGIKALAKETGGSFDTLTVALSRAGVNMQNALMEPSAVTAKVLAQVMGGAQNLANLGLKPMDERIQIVLQHIFALNDVGERNQALNALLGRGWQQNVEVLELLAKDGYGPAIEQAKKFGIYHDENAAKQAHSYTIEMHQLEGELSGLGLKIGSLVVPALARWMAELHTVNYEVKLLEVGLEAQGLSLLNFSNKVVGYERMLVGDWIGGFRQMRKEGGMFDKELVHLAEHATDLVTQEHQAMEAYKAEITAMGEVARNEGGEGAGVGSTGNAAAAADAQKQQEAANKLATDRIKAGQEMGRVLKELAADQLRENKAVYQYNQFMEQTARDSIAGLPIETQSAQSLRQMPTLYEQQVTAVKHLSAARKELIGISQSLRPIEEQFSKALHGDMSAMESLTQQGASIAGNIAGMVGGTKTAAEVKGAFDAALAIEFMAQFIGSWGTDTAALAASIQYGAAAVEMFKVAGRGGGGGASGSGGGGGGTASSYGRGGGGRTSGSGGSGGGAATPGGGGGGTTVHMNFPGGTLISPDTLPQIMAQMSQLAKGGQATLTATNALTNAEKLT